MKITYQWKLMACFSLLLAITGISIYAYLENTLHSFQVEENTTHLFNQARLARLMAMRDLGAGNADADGTAKRIGGVIRARITFVTPGGIVAGDSEVSREELRTLENHRDRPEIQQALATGSGKAIRYSATLHTPMLYVALPINHGEHIKGVIRLALPLSSLEKTEQHLRAMLAGTLAVALLVSLILSYLMTRVTSRSLNSMTEIAARFGKGDFAGRMMVGGSDELGELAGVMNTMADRIEGQLANISAEKNRLSAILRGMGEGLMVTDAKGSITLTNPSFHTLFGIEAEVSGRALVEISRHPALHAAFKSVMETGSERIEEMQLPLPGETTLLTHWVPLLEDGELTGVVAVFHDISELKRLELVRKDFVANVSHELRTPVSVIKGYAETLLAGVIIDDPKRAATFVETIHRHAERLTDIIADLLTLSEMESGRLPLALAPINLASVTNSVCKLLEEKARNKGVDVTCRGLDLQVVADRGRLEQIMLNLLDNAIKYTPEKGSVTISAESAGEKVRISVADSGIGIPARDLPRVFERFYRVDEARSREQGGTGLGLAIVKHIVQLHGGAISVKSEQGKGSTFIVTLKAA